MRKLLGCLMAIACAGCFSHGKALRHVDAPDPTIGDLHCAAPRISLLEALYFEPNAPLRCDARD